MLIENSPFYNTKKINKYIKWKPKFNNLLKILNSSYRWEKKLIKNFLKND